MKMYIKNIDVSLISESVSGRGCDLVMPGECDPIMLMVTQCDHLDLNNTLHQIGSAAM